MTVYFYRGADTVLTDADKENVGIHAPERVQPFLSLWGDSKETPLVVLDEAARDFGVDSIVIKDEAERLGLGSFKALGGAYAVMSIFRQMLEENLKAEVRIAQLTSPTAQKFAENITFCCATDGNHGKSVAAGARILGCRSVIFVHTGVTEARAAAIGASEIIRVDGNYDLSVEEAERAARENGWVLVSDTSWTGYETVPALVGQGYTILVKEALNQIAEIGMQAPTHVFLQAGVGGFAGSVSGHLSEVLGRDKIKTVVVEPDRAACLLVTAMANKLTSFAPTEPTIMAMLECYTPSIIAWRILQRTADAFMTVTEEDARDAMRALAYRTGYRRGIVAGESGAAGYAGLRALADNVEARKKLGLDSASRVLLINTEGATDPGTYEGIVGEPPAAIRSQFLSVSA